MCHMLASDGFDVIESFNRTNNVVQTHQIEGGLRRINRRGLPRDYAQTRTADHG